MTMPNRFGRQKSANTIKVTSLNQLNLNEMISCFRLFIKQFSHPNWIHVCWKINSNMNIEFMILIFWRFFFCSWTGNRLSKHISDHYDWISLYSFHSYTRISHNEYSFYFLLNECAISYDLMSRLILAISGHFGWLWFLQIKWST